MSSKRARGDVPVEERSTSRAALASEAYAPARSRLGFMMMMMMAAAAVVSAPNATGVGFDQKCRTDSGGGRMEIL